MIYEAPLTSGSDAPRHKSEVLFDFSASPLVFTQGVTYNLIDRIKATVPVFGSLLPFFDTAANLLRSFNDDTSLHFKANFIGSFTGSASTRSLELDFGGTQGNRLVQNRSVAVSQDVMTFSTFFSIDKDGFIATNGTPISIVANGGNFTCVRLLLIAEQETYSAEMLGGGV
ncbi:tail needle knob protein [Vibrio mimicus]|uniref:tail needle knob protein n=1 Tax=Vibrio mimicus TaxID=674 RepID=UPI002F9523ED